MKRNKTWVITGLFLILAIVFMACEKPDQPVYGEDVPDPNPTGKTAATVDSISPGEAYLKQVVTIYGKNFDSDPVDNLVAFGKRTGKIISATPNQLVVESPNISGETVDVRVAIKGSEFWSNSMSFTFKNALETLNEDILWPNGVAVDAAGNVYVGSAGDEAIYKLASDGTKSVFAASVPVSGAIEFGPNEYLYVCEQNEGKIVRISPDGSTVEDVVSVEAPVDFDWDADGNMYIASNSVGIKKMDSGGTVTDVASIGNPKSIRVFENSLYVSDIWEDRILKYDITGSGLENETPVVEGITAAGVELDSTGTLYYTHAWETSIYTLAPDGSEEVLFEGQLETPMRYLSFFGKAIYIVYPGWGDIGKVLKTYIGVEQAVNYGRQ
ncbi:MAG: IPT/TIG domain-containing protein [Calditrichia bacterium]